MQTTDLDFQLWINTSASFAELRNWFRKDWIDFGIEWVESTNSGTTAENWITLEQNGEYNPELTTSQNGWFYYPYVVNITFKNRVGTLDDVAKQESFACLITSKLESQGCSVTLIG